MGKTVEIGCWALAVCAGYALGKWMEPAFSAGFKTMILIVFFLAPGLVGLLSYRLNQNSLISIIVMGGIGIAAGIHYDRLIWGLPGLFAAFALVYVTCAAWVWAVDRIRSEQE